MQTSNSIPSPIKFALRAVQPLQIGSSSETTASSCCTIDSKTYSDLQTLLHEQFISENRLEENVTKHLDDFLQATNRDGLQSNSFWVIIANEEKQAVEDEAATLGEPAGFLCLCLLPKLNSKLGYSYVDELFVRNSYRRMGVATLLLDKAKEITRELNLAGVRLLVRKENESAQSLYSNNDFTISETYFCQHIFK